MNPIYMLLTIPFFLICLGLEYFIGKRKGKNFYRHNDTITNLNIGVGNQVFSLLFKGLLVGAFLWVSNNVSVFSISNSIFTWLICLLLFDFLYYWAHRWSHEVNILWGAHVVHHTSEDFNLGVALRQSWIHNLLAAFIFLPIPFIGFPPEVYLSVAGIVTLYQFWIHTEAIEKLPRLFEFIFNTPSHHRVHHASDPKYIDKNYAAVFIVWDRLFGTFIVEDERPTYGITYQLESWNPTWANLHYYVEIWNKAKGFKSVKEKLKILIARPGWQPDYLGGYEAPPEVDKSKRKYDVENRQLRAYVSFQFALIAIGLMAYVYHFSDLSLFFQWSFAALIILSTMTCGAMLEDKSWVVPTEYLRLIIILFSLNGLYYINYLDWLLWMAAFSFIVTVFCVVWFSYGKNEIQFSRV